MDNVLDFTTTTMEYNFDHERDLSNVNDGQDTDFAITTTLSSKSANDNDDIVMESYARSVSDANSNKLIASGPTIEQLKQKIKLRFDNARYLKEKQKDDPNVDLLQQAKQSNLEMNLLLFTEFPNRVPVALWSPTRYGFDFAGTKKQHKRIQKAGFISLIQTFVSEMYQNLLNIETNMTDICNGNLDNAKRFLTDLESNNNDVLHLDDYTFEGLINHLCTAENTDELCDLLSQYNQSWHDVKENRSELDLTDITSKFRYFYQILDKLLTSNDSNVARKKQMAKQLIESAEYMKRFAEWLRQEVMYFHLYCLIYLLFQIIFLYL